MAQLMSALLDFGSHLKDSNTDCLTSNETRTETRTELELECEIETLRLSCVRSIKTQRTSQFTITTISISVVCVHTVLEWKPNKFSHFANDGKSKLE